MKTEVRKCVIPFSEGGDTHNVGDKVLVLPSKELITRFCIALEFGYVGYIGKEYLSEQLKKKEYYQSK